MTIRALQFWLFLIGLLVLIDDGTGLTNFDDALTMAINRPEVLLDARRATTNTLKTGTSPPFWQEMMETGKKIAGNYAGIPKAEVYDENRAHGKHFSKQFLYARSKGFS
ncbi:hypothetical protein PCASD_03085 [Puccinia coronata f. sp. avenae]|uniref:SCP domain-containing protein n=1 Tax=Puccinia coronata f. sp. avenae TaxID=200324 RepID=A0A2N5V5T2_9BASI|nr:hypothetical protein PCASD_11097 [Puccinia coronata f. sp. avenae]PLW45345.1 hypothetical protein PCASD_03085 [Puccinia coronata f. sp. avenae]